MYQVFFIELATANNNHPDLSVWVAIAISTLSMIISVWRNNYDVESDKDKRVREMVNLSVRKIEEIEDKWDERMDKLDDVMDKITGATHKLESQVATLNAQMSFLLRDSRGQNRDKDKT